MEQKKYILQKDVADAKLKRMALEVAEQFNDDDDILVLLGVAKAGTTIANKLADLLQQYTTLSVEVATITLDKKHPKEVLLNKEINFSGKSVLLVDDVTNTGRTLLYAIKPLLAFIPKKIQTLVMIERMHRYFPVKPDFVGLSVATTPSENIEVLIENEEVVGALIR